MADHEVPVLIVGGSLVGMSTALLLGHHGVRAIAVEHHRGTAIHPRAAQVTQRTMEIFRQVGLEPIIRERSGEQFVQDGAIMAVETLAGRELAYFIANLNEGIRDVSPCERVFISQSLLEPLLASRARELGATLRFGADVIAFDQDPDGVSATIRDRDSGREETVRAAYMVAADGARSRVRDALGIPMTGRGAFSRSATIYFRANVAPLLRGRNLSVIYVNHPELRGFFRFEKPFDSGFLAVNGLGDPEHPITDVTTDLTEARCLEWIRLALGDAGIPVTIEGIMPWDAAADVAERLEDRRVFLSGDAVHVMPPNGGFGGNTGVQDAHNLAWKLAMVLRGEASADLLRTYEAERQPVGAFTTEQAYTRYVTRTAPYLGKEGLQPAADDLNVELGYLYRSIAIPGRGCDGGPPHEHPRDTRGRPGSRAPHVWMDGPGGASTLDWFGRRFVVVAGADAGPWCDAARVAGRTLGLDVDIQQLDETLGGPGGAVVSAYGLSPAGASLVRPDGFVGWRSADAGRERDSCLATLAGALSAMTGRA